MSLFSTSPSLAQVAASDSLKIAKLITDAQAQLTQHNYQQAITVAQQGLDRSTKLDFKWGFVNSLLVIAQSQKALRNFPASLNHYLQVLPEVEKKNDALKVEWVNYKIGELFQEWGVPEKALPYYNKALALQTTKSNNLLERIAEVYFSLNQRDQSLKMYSQLLEIHRQKNDLKQMRSTLEKMAFIYSQSNDIESSLKYRFQLLDINKQLKDDEQVASTLNSIGNYYKDLKRYDKALESYQAALSINKQISSDGKNNSVVTNLINIGNIYQTLGDNQNAIRSLNEALQIKIKSGTPSEVAVMNNFIAALYQAQGNFSEAEQYTKDAIDILSKTDNKRALAAAYKRLSDLYAKQGSYEKSLTAYQTYSMLKDSLLYREQLNQEKENLKEYVIQATEKEAKLNSIDYEMQALELRNAKEIAEREKQKLALSLKEKELQNLVLQKEQSEQARAVQQLKLQQTEAEKEKKDREIILLEQKRDLQNVEIQKKELERKERLKEIDFKNTKLALQQAQLERVNIRQRYLIFIAVLFFVLILFILIGYIIKRRDNKLLTAQNEEITRQKEQIESINKSLVELNEEKNDLIGIVAHDLKSPLNQISGLLEIMRLEEKNRGTNSDLFAEQIGKATDRLKRMVTKILDVSAIEAKTLNITIEKINIIELLHEIINRFTEMASKKHIVIVKEFAVEVLFIESDKGYVSEVLENLMSNAVKYSPLERKIIVKLNRKINFARIEFIDQGQGISEKDMKNLF
ncbi:MAG TPA: hypothetical protein DGG95_00085, partial [Cytophagales bacterium]|nr:hypothetical protein [Cytophagales bacterium]